MSPKNFSRRKFLKFLALPVAGVTLPWTNLLAWNPFAFWGYKGTFIFNATIAADTYNYSIASAAAAAGWDSIAPLRATITINAGVTVGSASTASPAFQTGTITSGSDLTLINNGSIMGMGGSGGEGGTSNGGTPGNPGGVGGAGGTGLRATYAIKVSNNGTIAGGGGGGGGGGGTASPDTGYGTTSTGGGGGGGGQGHNSSLAGVAGLATNATTNTQGVAGAIGTKAGAGAGGTVSTASYGGSGGTLGLSGGNGMISYFNGSAYVPTYVASSGNDGLVWWSGCGLGGAAGSCTIGNANITWTVVGTRSGALN